MPAGIRRCKINVARKNNRGRSALDLAMSKGHESIAAMIKAANDNPEEISSPHDESRQSKSAKQ